MSDDFHAFVRDSLDGAALPPSLSFLPFLELPEALTDLDFDIEDGIRDARLANETAQEAVVSLLVFILRKKLSITFGVRYFIEEF